MKIIYVRHGYPSYDPDCLTSRGKYEAEQTANYLSKFKIDKIISSDSNRAFETASYLSKKLNLDIQKYHCLNENIAFDYFSCEENGVMGWTFYSKNYLELFIKHKNNPNWQDSEDFKNTKIIEGYQKISSDLDYILLSINIVHDRKNKSYQAIGNHPEILAIFAHGGMGTAVISSLLDSNYCTQIAKYSILDTCGICEFDIDLDDTHQISLHKYNFIAYDVSEAEKLPMKL